MRHFPPSFVVLYFTSILSSACLETGYVLQAVEGQLDLMCRARDVDAVIEDADTDPRVKELLLELPKIKNFAAKQGLVPTGNYESYVDLDRPAAVFVVSATPALSLDPLTWTFPIVGSVPYLGWFDHYRAVDHARSLQDQGYDVELRGASAYSTLGWFSDPVLSSMLDSGPSGAGELADTILHESVHASIYVPDQASFNEGLATFVGSKLAVTYLEQVYGKAAPELSSYLDGVEAAKQRRVKMSAAFHTLSALYASKAPDSEKQLRKRWIFARLGRELRMKRKPNNATLAGFRTYHGERDDFAVLYERCGSMRKLLAAAKLVRGDDFPSPQARDLRAVVDRLASRGCP